MSYMTSHMYFTRACHSKPTLTPARCRHTRFQRISEYLSFRGAAKTHSLHGIFTDAGAVRAVLQSRARRLGGKLIHTDVCWVMFSDVLVELAHNNTQRRTNGASAKW